MIIVERETGVSTTGIVFNICFGAYIIYQNLNASILLILLIIEIFGISFFHFMKFVLHPKLKWGHGFTKFLLEVMILFFCCCFYISKDRD